MRLRARGWMVVFMVGLIAAGLALPALAQTTTPAATATATTPSSCSGYAGLTHKLVGCMRDTIDAAAVNFFAQIYPYLKVAIDATLTLAIIVYGVMLSIGLVEKVGRDTFVLLLKIASVAFFVSSSPYMLKVVTGGMDSAAAAVISFTPSSGPADGGGSNYSQSVCMQNMIAQQGTTAPGKPVITPWLGIDCLVDSVIGIKLGGDSTTPPAAGNQYFNKVLDNANPTNSNVGMSRALIHFFFSTMQTSVFGALFAVVGFFFIFGLLMLIVRTLFIYLAGYIGITLLIIVSPLMIPLILFPRTKDYFDKWSKLLISFALQPVVMMAYIIFSLTAVDLATFSADYSIMYRIAGDAIHQPTFDLNAYLTVPRNPDGSAQAPTDPAAAVKTYPPCATCKAIIIDKPRTVGKIKGDNATPAPVTSKDQGGTHNGTKYTGCTPDAIKADTSGTLKKVCETVYEFKVSSQNVNWDLLAAAHQPAITPSAGKTAGQEIEAELLASLFFSVMVVFVLNGLLAVIPMIISDILGDLGQSPDLGGAFSGGSGGKPGIMSGITGKLTEALGKKK